MDIFRFIEQSPKALYLKVHKRENFLGSDFEIPVLFRSWLSINVKFCFKFLLNHYWGRQDCSAYTEITQKEKFSVS